jgi:hypothetical protein
MMNERLLFVPDPPTEVQQQILDAYMEYLAAPAPPEHGLHYSIAGRIGKVSPRQVHKVLQKYRHKMRAEYPLCLDPLSVVSDPSPGYPLSSRSPKVNQRLTTDKLNN